jgi:hypothetical protein
MHLESPKMLDTTVYLRQASAPPHKERTMENGKQETSVNKLDITDLETINGGLVVQKVVDDPFPGATENGPTKLIIYS